MNYTKNYHSLLLGKHSQGVVDFWIFLSNSALCAHSILLHRQAAVGWCSAGGTQNLTYKKHKEEPNEIVFPQTKWQRKVSLDLGSASVSKSWVGLLSALAMLSTWPRASLRYCSGCTNTLMNFSRKHSSQALPVFERYPGGKKEQSSWSFMIA